MALVMLRHGHRSRVGSGLVLLGLSLVALAADAGAERAVTWESGVVVDVLRPGSSPAVALTHVDLRLTADAGLLFGWTGTTLRIEALADHGGKPNRRVGTLQGLSNIEVGANGVRLYSLWAARDLAPGVHVLAGLYDLNAEFYVTDASAALIHPAFGIGAELAQTGRNGPSVFPDLALGARLKAASDAGFYLQGVVLDVVAGNPDHPGSPGIRLSRSHGALVVAEAGWQQGASADGATSPRWGIGTWRYTRPVERLDGAGTASSSGLYVLGQASIGSGAGQAVMAFLRAGVANRQAHPIGAAFTAGISVSRPWGSHGPALVTAGLAVAYLGRAYRHLQAPAAGGAETTIEGGARWHLGRELAVQPLVQRVWHPAGRTHGTATVVGVRWIWSFAPRAGA